MRSATAAISTPLWDLKREHSDAAIARARDEASAMMIGAGEAEAFKAVAWVAEALQVNVPSKMGLLVYYRILGAIPLDLLREATKRVLETHTFNVLPAPAKWREAVKDELAERANVVTRLNVYQGKLRLAEKAYPTAIERPQDTTVTDQQREGTMKPAKDLVEKLLPPKTESCITAGDGGSSSRHPSNRDTRKDHEHTTRTGNAAHRRRVDEDGAGQP